MDHASAAMCSVNFEHVGETVSHDTELARARRGEYTGGAAQPARCELADPTFAASGNDFDDSWRTPS